MDTTALDIVHYYNHLNGHSISLPTLVNLHERVRSHLDNVGHGPYTTDLKGVLKRVARAIKKFKAAGVQVADRVKLDPINIQETTPSKKQPRNKNGQFMSNQPGYARKHLKKIAAQNKRMPKPMRDIMNGMEYGLEAMAPEGEESGLGFSAGGQEKIYNMVTNLILEAMKKEDLFWQKPWSLKGYSSQNQAQNFATKKPYAGVNFWITNFVAPSFGKNSIYFLTFKQVKDLGGTVKKGAKSFPVLYYNVFYIVVRPTRKTISEDEYKAMSHDQRAKVGAQKIPFVQYYSVFNGDDIEGIEFPAIKSTAPSEKEKIESCEAIVEGMPQRPPIKHGGDRAFYSHADYIQMPPLATFNKEQEYYSTLFHEMIHATGAPHRLNREKGKRFGDVKYAFEELIAELGASYLCAESGILYFTMNNSAAYLKNWSSKVSENMKKDNQFFLRAAAQAQKGSDFILDRLDREKKELKQVARLPMKRPNRNASKSIRANKCPVVRPERKESGQAAAKHSTPLSGVSYKYYAHELGSFKDELVRMNSDANAMFWGQPGHGKTYKLLKLAKHFADQGKPTLYIAEEEYGKSTLDEKLTELQINEHYPNLDITGELNENELDKYQVIFFDSVNTLKLTPARVRALEKKHPNRTFILVVQTTKEGDFRGGQDWEHLVDVAGEIKNRVLILSKNRFDKETASKAQKKYEADAIEEAKRKAEIRKVVSESLKPKEEAQQQAA